MSDAVTGYTPSAAARRLVPDRDAPARRQVSFLVTATVKVATFCEDDASVLRGVVKSAAEEALERAYFDDVRLTTVLIKDVQP